MQSDKEKIAIVLINRYKDMVDKFKKWRLKSAFTYIQIAEMELHNFTENKPIARKFFERILEYRRKGADEIETFEIPRIETDFSGGQESPSPPAPEPERRKTAVATKNEPKKAETKQEKCPFEF